jgi:hypothetical protein
MKFKLWSEEETINQYGPWGKKIKEFASKLYKSLFPTLHSSSNISLLLGCPPFFFFNGVIIIFAFSYSPISANSFTNPWLQIPQHLHGLSWDVISPFPHLYTQ